MRQIRLYLHSLKTHIESVMQHRISFLLTMIGQFLVSFNMFLGVFFMTERSHQVSGFTYPQMLLYSAIIPSSPTPARAFLRGSDMFSDMIGNREFNQVLPRSMGPIYQVPCSKFELTRVERLLQAIAMLAYAIPRSRVDWTGKWVMTPVTMIAGGTAVFAGIFIIYVSLCFFTLEGLEFMDVFMDGAREYRKHPIGICGKTVLAVCICLTFLALFQYYLFLYLVGTSHNW